MGRLARIVVSGIPHHVVQRGNRRMDVFFSDADREQYIDFLSSACEKYGVDIWSWCLMSNHVHFIAVPKQEDSLAKCFSDAHVKYTRMINFREKWKGHLWQGRFSSSPLHDQYLLAAVRYVERNPVRAKIVRLPWKYEYSSTQYHIGKTESDPLIKNDGVLLDMIDNWREYLHNKDDEDDLNKIRKEEAGGRPIGHEGFIKSIENKLKRKFDRKPMGRPAKK
jgi:putative transposase